MKNHVFHERSKQIRQCVENGSVLADFISTSDELADIGMQALGRVRFQELIARIEMVKIKSKLKHKT
jgi:hypothetical protein